MKKTLLCLIFLFSNKSFALSCADLDLTDAIKKADYIFKGTLLKKEKVKIGDFLYTRNHFKELETLKGNPDYFSALTMNIEDSDGHSINYSVYNQVDENMEYFIFGNYGKESYSGPCGGYLFKPYSYVLEPLRTNLNYIYDKKPLESKQTPIFIIR